MNKRFFLAWIAVFLAWMAGSVVVHGLLLHDDYAKLPHLFRSESESEPYFPLMILAHVVMAGAFVWIYGRGVDAKPWLGQGLRFGIAVALMTVVPTYTIYYVVQPMPGLHAVKQIVFDGLLIILLAVLVASILRSPTNRQPAATPGPLP